MDDFQFLFLLFFFFLLSGSFSLVAVVTEVGITVPARSTVRQENKERISFPQIPGKSAASFLNALLPAPLEASWICSSWLVRCELPIYCTHTLRHMLLRCSSPLSVYFNLKP